MKTATRCPWAMLAVAFLAATASANTVPISGGDSFFADLSNDGSLSGPGIDIEWAALGTGAFPCTFGASCTISGLLGPEGCDVGFSDGEIAGIDATGLIGGFDFSGGTFILSGPVDSVTVPVTVTGGISNAGCDFGNPGTPSSWGLGFSGTGEVTFANGRVEDGAEIFDTITLEFTGTANTSVGTTPEPSALLLFSTGLLGFAILMCRRRKSVSSTP